MEMDKQKKYLKKKIHHNVDLETEFKFIQKDLYTVYSKFHGKYGNDVIPSPSYAQGNLF